MPATLKRQTKKKKTPKARLTVTPVQSQAAKPPSLANGVGLVCGVPALEPTNLFWRCLAPLAPLA